ncbi:DnaJ domain-containing protein [Myxococcota bacterium]|nr:DnaJ domain-containing protein [Myxococcota bacterium]MBU1897747.1 DnaJ domain-containing protein [Myxococcota bacterium]
MRGAPVGAPPPAMRGAPSRQQPSVSRPPPVHRPSARPAPAVTTPAQSTPNPQPQGAEARAARAKEKRGARPLNEATRAKLAQAEVLLASLEEKNYYEILGVARDADEASVKAAFRVFARDYHLDRFTRFDISEAQKKVIQDVFIAVNRAHEVISDPQKRAEYDAGLDLGHKSPQRPSDAKAEMERVFKAEKLVRDAIRLLGNSSFVNALSQLTEALSLTPDDSLAKAAHAYANFMVVYSKGGSVQVASQTIELLNGLIETLDGRYEPYLYLGRVYRVLEDYDRSVQALSKASEIGRHIPEIKSELRHVQRKLEERNAKRKPLFGRKK